jgi:flagellar hook-associated protein 1 FlgK
MSGIFNIFNIAREALYANQAGIQVTGNNIANVNTPGYARQRVVLEQAAPVTTGYGLVGSGVRIEGVTNIRDAYLDNQILKQRQTLGQYTALNDMMEQIELIFNESVGLGMSEAISNFFNAFSDLANNPQGIAERESVKQMGLSLVSNFAQTDANLRQLRSDCNDRIRAEALEINEIIDEIAELNGLINSAEATGDRANDYRDQRSVLLDKLAEKIDISFLENEDNQAFVFLSTGKSLVVGSDSYNLRMVTNANNSGYYDVELDIGSGTYGNITSEISDGNLAGLVEMRDTYVVNTMDKLDQLAAAIINEVNILHTMGYGLDASTGINFFDPLNLTVQEDSDNTGSGVISSVSIDQSAINRDNFEIRFTDSSTFTIYNVTDGVAVSSGNSYVSGNNITFEGITVSISGSVDSGDVFIIRSASNAARDISINSTIANNVEKIAAAQDSSSLPGDNTNALAIAALQDTLTLLNDTSTFEDYMASIVSDIGIQASTTSFSKEQKEAMVIQLENRREQISGVSLDEEAINLIKFQSGYEAAAKLIVTVDEMLDILVNLVR